MSVSQSHTAIAQEPRTSTLVQDSLERALNSFIRTLSAMMYDDVEGLRLRRGCRSRICLVVERMKGQRLNGDKEKVSCVRWGEEVTVRLCLGFWKVKESASW